MDLTPRLLSEWRATRLPQFGYAPLADQVPVLASPERQILLAGGEGAGKSHVTAAFAVACDPWWTLTYIVAPKYESAHPEFDYISEWLTQLAETGPSRISRPSHGQCSLTTFDGRRLITLSSEDGPKAITGTGESPDLILMVEAGKQTQDIYLACRGRVARSRGLLFLSGTFESSSDWYADLWTRWQGANPERGVSFSLATWTNTVLYPQGAQDPEILALQATYPPDKFSERFGARPVPPSNLVLKEFNHIDHVKPAPYWRGDPNWAERSVEMWVDPGYAGAYAALAVQVDGDTVWVMDEVYAQFGIASEIIGACQQRPWWRLVRGGVIDVAGRQHQGMRSHEEIWLDEARVMLRSQRVLVDEGITRHRTFLRNPMDGNPRLFHDPRCRETVAEYRKYKRNPETGAVVDRDNHAMKAIAYGLVDHFGLADRTTSRLPATVERELSLERELSQVYRGRTR